MVVRGAKTGQVDLAGLEAAAFPDFPEAGVRAARPPPPQWVLALLRDLVFPVRRL